MKRMILIAGLALALAACGDDDGGGANQNTVPDAGLDATPPDAAPDAAPDAGPAPTCRTDLITDQTFALDPEGPDTQIHPAARFDGESVWIVYNVPDASGLFDVRATRLDCDGTARVAPFRVNEAVDGNDVDPALDVGDGNLYLAWHSDNQTGADNMDIVYRTFTVDGTPIMLADAILETTKRGVPVTGNAMTPQVAALPGEGFAIAGIRGVADASAWQVFVQFLGTDGTLEGEAVDPAFEPTVSQMNPTIASLGGGAAYLAYERAELDGPSEVVHTVLVAGQAPAPSPPVPVTADPAGEYPVAAAAPTGEAFVVWAGDSGPVLADGADLTGDAASMIIDGSPGMNFAPAVAARPGGGAVAWFLNLSGLRNELWLAPFGFAGATFTQGQAARVFPAAVPPYPIALTWVGGSTYFLAWAEGQNPAFRVYGRFVTVE